MLREKYDFSSRPEFLSHPSNIVYAIRKRMDTPEEMYAPRPIHRQPMIETRNANGDEKRNLFVVNSSGMVAVLYGNGTGTFQNRPYFTA